MIVSPAAARLPLAHAEPPSLPAGRRRRASRSRIIPIRSPAGDAERPLLLPARRCDARRGPRRSAPRSASRVRIRRFDDEERSARCRRSPLSRSAGIFRAVGDPLHAASDRARLMWQSKTFTAKIETRGSRAGTSPSLAAAPHATGSTRPSAGLTTRPGAGRHHAHRIAEEQRHPSREDQDQPEQRRRGRRRRSRARSSR